jgi:hypothetical protein
VQHERERPAATTPQNISHPEWAQKFVHAKKTIVPYPNGRLERSIRDGARELGGNPREKKLTQGSLLVRRDLVQK